MDSIEVKALRVLTRIGVYHWEQKILQTLFIDISIPTHLAQCQDNLANTIDYEKLCCRVKDYLTSHVFSLIETVAEKIASLIKSEFKVDQVTVSVCKPHAIKTAQMVKVTVQR